MSRITVVEFNDISKSAHAHNITAALLDLGYEVNLLGFNADRISEPMLSNPDCHIYNIVGKASRNKIDAIVKRIERRLLIKKTFKECMKDSLCVWVVSLAGFIPLKREVIKYDNVVRVAELVGKLRTRDRILGHSVIRRIRIEKEIAKAQRIVVPEINRAYIQKAWWKLPELPMVIPNKPYSMDTGELPENVLKAVEILKNEKKKIILYMGVVGPDRNIEDFAGAVSGSDKYAFYLAGNVLPYARESLKRIEAYGGKYLGLFSRPGHLELIKYAHIGALPYTPSTLGADSELNALYCAPNKIFEYAGFGVPMIGSDVFGLEEPFEKWNIGACCSDQPDSIVRAIERVEEHYDQMRENCKRFYDSVDVKALVESTLDDIGIRKGIKKIRILMTVPDLLYAGIQRFAVNLVNTLDPDRYRIDFYVYKKFDETYEPYLKSLGCKVYYAKSNGPSIRGFIKTSLQLDSFLQTHHYDIVMCHSCQSRGIFKGEFGTKLNGHPVVIAHAHGMDRYPDTIKGRLQAGLYPAALRMAGDYFFACSEAAGRTKFGKSFSASDRCRYIRNAVNIDAFRYSGQLRAVWRNKLGAQKDTVIVGNVARFAAGKNHEMMISVFADFNKKHPDSLMVFVGDGALLNKVREAADAHGIAGKVVFLGSRTDVNEIINAFDVFLFPSESEGLGFVLIESQVNGLHCVISADVIPDEADLDIGLIKRVSLDAPAGEWADCCYEEAVKGRLSADACVMAAKDKGYDLAAQSASLDEFFQGVVRNNMKNKR